MWKCLFVFTQVQGWKINFQYKVLGHSRVIYRHSKYQRMLWNWVSISRCAKCTNTRIWFPVHRSPKEVPQIENMILRDNRIIIYMLSESYMISTELGMMQVSWTHNEFPIHRLWQVSQASGELTIELIYRYRYRHKFSMGVIYSVS